MNFTHNH